MKRATKTRNLSHRAKAVRNVLVTLALLIGLWAYMDYPLPQTMQFRRLERAHLLPKSEIVYRDSENVVGVWDDEAIAAWLSGSTPDTWRFCRYPLNEEGPTIIPLRSELPDSGNPLEQEAVIAVNVPDAASITAILHLSHGNWERNQVIDGQRLSEGVWFCPFRFDEENAEPDHERFWAQMDFYSGESAAPYTLNLYGEDGGKTAQFEGRLPLGEEN